MLIVNNSNGKTIIQIVNEVFMLHQTALKPEERTKELPTIENRLIKTEREIEILKADIIALRTLLHAEGSE